MSVSRKKFIGLFVVGALVKFATKANFLFGRTLPKFPYVRPPGVGVTFKDEMKFLEKCIRCRACADVCAAGCIKFFSASESTAMAGTPYLNTREKSCNLCTNCTIVCPTGALEKVENNLEDIKKKFRMGTAYVIESHCLSHNGRICGICRDACPLSGEAITLVPRAKPVVDEDVCIGCGRCEERCPQFPAAIIVRREGSQYEA